MKNNQKINLVLAICLCFISLKANAQCSQAWKYFVPVTVTNTTSATLSDFQVKITLNTATPITANKMNSTGDDIRFTDNNLCKNLPYWIESGINTSNTVIWVKIPSLQASANRSLRMYYGNPSASAVSNGDSTFLFFDDFSGSSLNSAKWTVTTTGTGSGGTVGVSNSKLNCSTSLEANIRSKASFSNPIIVEDNVTALSGSWESIAVMNATSNDGYTMAMGDVRNGFNTMYFGNTQTPANPDCHGYTANFTNSNTSPGVLTGIWQFSWSASNAQFASWPGGSFNYSVSGISLANFVQVAIGNLCGANGSMSIDWVRVRNFAVSEATTSVGSETDRSGIENSLSASDLKTYPNPVREKLYINLNDCKLNLEKLELMDINGRVIQTLDIKNNDGMIELPVNDLSKGIYFIRFTGNEVSMVQKIITE